MASVNKIRISSTDYDVSPSPSGTLETDTSKSSYYTSLDESSPTSWTATDVIAATDTNSSIFSKLTSMVKNIRFLYSKLGTTSISSIGDGTVTGAISSVNSGLEGKANIEHSHTVADLPVSSTQIDSTSYIPTSSLIYSMNEELTSINNADIVQEDFTTTTTVGQLAAGTTVTKGTNVIQLIKSLTGKGYPEPSTEYESKQVEQYGTWSSTTDVNNFFNTYTYENGWSGLKIGNYVTISDGTYNKQWVIAGFNCEHNQTASDGTVYDNGYGIVMIPRVQLTTYNWHSITSFATPYKDSDIHTYINDTVYNALKNVCGSHIVQRNVLLGSACTGTSPRSWTTSAYTWTTAYLTLMSVGQMAGSSYFGNYNNSYDDGEAAYHLPLFDHENYYSSSEYYWTRNVYGYDSSIFCAWNCLTRASFKGLIVDYNTRGVRPLMYLR